MKLGDTEYGWPHAIIAICGVLTAALTLVNSCQNQTHARLIEQNASRLDKQKRVLTTQFGSNYVGLIENGLQPKKGE